MGGLTDGILKFWHVIAFFIIGIISMIGMWFKTQRDIQSHGAALKAHEEKDDISLKAIQKQVDNIADQFFQHHKNAAERYGSLNERIDEVLKILINKGAK